MLSLCYLLEVGRRYVGSADHVEQADGEGEIQEFSNKKKKKLSNSSIQALVSGNF